MSRLLRSRQSESGEGAGGLRKLGIIGGASWSSTALYYEHINRGVAQRLGGLHSATLVIESLDFETIMPPSTARTTGTARNAIDRRRGEAA